MAPRALENSISWLQLEPTLGMMNRPLMAQLPCDKIGIELQFSEQMFAKKVQDYRMRGPLNLDVHLLGVPLQRRYTIQGLFLHP
jgi:hypothetical protein